MKEIRKMNVIFNKNSKGFTSTKIALPVPWVKELGFTETDKEATVEIEDNKITIKKSTDDNKKEFLINSAKKILEDLQKGETHIDRRESKKNKLNKILSELNTLNIDIDFIKEYSFIKEVKKDEKSVKIIYKI